MNKEEFRKHIIKSLKELKLMADQWVWDEVPEIGVFKWGHKDNEVEGFDNIVEEILSEVYIDENNIYPCVDLIIKYDESNEERMMVLGARAGFEPRPFQNGWTNRPGPFIYCIGFPNHPMIDIGSTKFRKNLIDLGLWHFDKEE